MLAELSPSPRPEPVKPATAEQQFYPDGPDPFDWRTTVAPPATAVDKRATGLYAKFIVTRTDGKSAPGEKHDGCDYFVLDLTHDPHALSAAVAYADDCEREYPVLARDLRRRLYPHVPMPGPNNKPAAPVSSSARPDSQTVEQAKARVLDMMRSRGYGSLAYEPVIDALILAVRQEQADARPARTLRRCGMCHTWNSKPCGEQCGWSPDDPVFVPTLLTRYKTGGYGAMIEDENGQYVRFDALLSGGAK